MGIAMVTGPSSGIGRATAVELGRRGLHVVAAGRSAERIRPVVEEIRGRGAAEHLQLDLASLGSVREAAQTFLASGRALDVLVNNAGVGPVKGVTTDGFEVHYGVNHLGHFALTKHLEPAFRPGTRIVTVSSAAHYSAPGIVFDRLRQRTRSFYGLKEYAVSKLCNILFTRQLALRHPGWRTYAVHPGMVYTNIFPEYVKPLLRPWTLPPSQGAETVVWCASSPEVEEESGLYYTGKTVTTPSLPAQDDDLATRLWEHSEECCRVER